MKPADRIGRWTLIRRLGEGAFGETWAAQDPDGRIGALKKLPEVPGEELRALELVCHPAVVGVLDSGLSPPFLVMELAPGQTLEARLRAGPLPEEEVLRIGATLADALATLHAAGVIHGDIKPANVMSDGERLCLVDFGAANSMGGAARYAAPERLVGRTTSSSDVYALGLLLRELLEGGLPLDELGMGVAPDKPMSAGSDWMRSLLGQMCAPHEGARPSAVDVADALTLRGGAIAPMDAGLLLGRARRARVPRVELDRSVRDWLKRGGQLVLQGPPGSGKSRALRYAATELQAAGRPWVRLFRSDEPWAAAESVLGSMGLSLPDPGPLRAGAIAMALSTVQGLRVLVDEADSLDPCGEQVLEALLRSEVAVLAAVTRTRPGAHTLVPMTRQGLRELSEAVLGRLGDLPGLADALHEVSDGWPGPAVALLVAALGEGRLVRRAGTWHLSSRGLEGLELRAKRSPDLPISEAARRLGALLTVYGLAMPLGLAARLMGDEEPGATRELVDAGLVDREAGLLRLTAAGRGLRPDDPQWAYRALLAGWHASRTPADSYLCCCVGAQDVDAAARAARRGVQAALRRDPGVAAELASAVLALLEREGRSVAGLPGLYVRALAGAGRPDQAREVVAAHADDPEVLLGLASHLIDIEGSGPELSGLLDAARALGTDSPEVGELEFRNLYRSGRLAEAVAQAKELAGGPPPEDEDGLDRWLRIRAGWAEALGAPKVAVHADTAPAAGLAVLADVPASAGRGRAARSRLDGVEGRLLFLDGQVHDAIRVTERAADPANNLPPLERARVMNNLAVFHHTRSDRRAALAAWERGLLLFEELGAGVEQVRVQINLCVGYREAGRYERALHAGTNAVEAAERLGQDELACVATGNLGDLHMARDDLVAAASCYRIARRTAERLHLSGELLELGRREAELEVRRHRPQALQAARKAEGLARSADNQAELSYCLCLQAVCWARRGDRTRVDQLLAEALEPLRRSGAAAVMARARLLAAEALAALGETTKAREHAEWTSFYASEVQHRQFQQQAEDLLASFAAASSASAASAALQRLLGLSMVVEHATDLSSVLDNVSSAALELLQADRSFVLLRSPDGLQVVSSALREDAEPGTPAMSIVRRAVSRGGREVIAADLDERGGLHSESVEDLRLGSAMCVPLVHAGDVLGAIYVDARLRAQTELSKSAWLLRSLASTAATAVANIRSIEESARERRRARELAHDIRGCLTTVLLVADELSGSTHLDAFETEAVAALGSSAARVVNMVEAFLQARNSEPMLVDLSSVCEEVVAAMGLQARGRQVRLHVDADPVIVRGQRPDLSRVVLNLVGNSLKYAPSGTRVSISVTRNGQYAVLAVEDEGPGLPEADLERLFDSGRQAADALPGYGLGLGIVHRIAQEHNGRVRATNRPRGGSRFEVILPAEGNP